MSIENVEKREKEIVKRTQFLDDKTPPKGPQVANPVVYMTCQKLKIVKVYDEVEKRKLKEIEKLKKREKKKQEAFRERRHLHFCDL